MHIFCGRGLPSLVHKVHIGPMNPLATWMSEKELNDAALAEKVRGALSRSQISRIRRGKSGTSPDKARKLEKITGIPWHEFIAGGHQ